MINTLAKALAPRQKTTKRCPTCGSDADLVRRMIYVGGTGYMWRWECRSSVECWKRWDRQHNLRPVVR